MSLFLIQNMKRSGVKSVSIIQTPDYSGGYRQQLHYSSDEDEDWYADLGDFTYVEWVGTPIDLYKKEPWLCDHIEPFHEEPRDYERPWWVDAKEDFAKKSR